MNTHGTTAIIDLNALRNNLSVIKKIAPKSKVLAMIKSNAYGHGAIKVAKTLEDKADAFGVACISEALTLHEAGIKNPIVLMQGFINIDELQIIDKYKFETVVHNEEQLVFLEKAKLTQQLKIWLKIDTGMHRLGFQENLANDAYQRLMQNNQIAKLLRIMTHMSDADTPEKSKTAQQIKLFEKITANFTGEKSIANSATILTHKEAHADWIRPGIALYGVSPFSGKTIYEYGFEPVMALEATLIAIQRLATSETVGYGSTWKAPCEMCAGIVNTGYGDGYPRSSITPNIPVLINGKATTLIGRISMDMLNIDLRNVPNVKVGDIITFWGKGLPVENTALLSNTIPYELFCQLTQRVVYKYINE